MVDASASAVAPPPAPVAGAPPEDEVDEDEPAASVGSTPTITLPARPAPPTRVSDLTEPDVEEPVVDDEPDDGVRLNDGVRLKHDGVRLKPDPISAAQDAEGSASK